MQMNEIGDLLPTVSVILLAVFTMIINETCHGFILCEAYMTEAPFNIFTVKLMHNVQCLKWLLRPRLTTLCMKETYLCDTDV